MIGVTGLGPATFWSQTRRSSQTELHPVISACHSDFLDVTVTLCLDPTGLEPAKPSACKADALPIELRALVYTTTM